VVKFVLLERGDCHFVDKSRNVQYAGGQLTIIIDETNEMVSSVLMSDDGTGAGLLVPTMMVGRRHG
jgi:hypothetical protein